MRLDDPIPPSGLVRRWLLSLPVVVLVGCGSGPDYDQIGTVSVSGREIGIDVAPQEESDGPEYVRLRNLADEEGDPLYLGEVANDGVELTLDNIRPDPSDAPNLRLCLNGSGQGDLYVRINVNSSTVTEIPRDCNF